MSNDQPVPYYLRPDRTKLSETAHDEDSLEPHPSGDPGTRTEGPVEYPVASQAPPGAATKGDEPVLVGAPPADPMTRQAPPLSWPRPAPPPQAAGNDSTLLRTAPAYDGPRAAAFPAWKPPAVGDFGKPPGIYWDPADLAMMPVIPIHAWVEDTAPTYGFWPRGWLIVDAIGRLWQCAVTGEPGTWQLVAGGGGITEITSNDGSVVVTDPTGPTTDLSVAAAIAAAIAAATSFGQGSMQYAVHGTAAQQVANGPVSNGFAISSLAIPQRTVTEGNPIFDWVAFSSFVAGAPGGTPVLETATRIDVFSEAGGDQLTLTVTAPYSTPGHVPGNAWTQGAIVGSDLSWNNDSSDLQVVTAAGGVYAVAAYFDIGVT